MPTLYGYVSNTPGQFYDDIQQSGLPKEEKVKLINQRAEEYNKQLQREALAGYGRIGLGSLLEGASMHPALNIPYVGTGLGGALYGAGDAIMQGKPIGEIAQGAGQGFLIGETVGAIPYAGKGIAKTKAGQALGKFGGGVVNKIGQTQIGQKIGQGLGKIEDVLLTDIKAFNPNKQTMYHGSPYDFNKFSNEAIGTGEGAQAHGYGHYAALDKGVANNYRWTLNADTSNGFYPILYNGERVPTNTKEGQLISQIVDNYKKYGLKNYAQGKEEIIEPYKKLIDKPIKGLEHLTDTAKQNLPIVENIDTNAIKEWEGQLYKLSVPKDDVMLREGATFAQQPKKVQEAIKSIVKENPELAEVIDTRTADEFFEIAQNKLGKKGKNIMKEVFDAELSGDENKITNAWNKYNEFESKNPNITRTNFDPNEIYGYLKNYRNNGVDETGQLFQNQYSNTNLYKYLRDERNFNKALYDKGIKGISYNGGIDGEAAVIFNPDDIDIVRKFYNQPGAMEYLKKINPNIGSEAEAINKGLVDKKYWKQYAKENMIGKSVNIPGYTDVTFTNKNLGEDYIHNMPQYPTLFDRLTNSKYHFSTNYKREPDRLYDHLLNTENDDLFDYLIEVIKEDDGTMHHNYKMMKNIKKGEKP